MSAIAAAAFAAAASLSVTLSGSASSNTDLQTADVSTHQTHATLGAPISAPELSYPYAAWRRGLSGTCVVSMVIGQNGNVASVNDVRCTSPAFTHAARAYAREVRYAPHAGGLVRHELTIEWHDAASHRDQPRASAAAFTSGPR